MPIRVKISMAPGEVFYKKAFDHLGDTISDISNFSKDFFSWFRDLAKDQFDQQGSPSWPALAPKYQAWKNRYYPGRPILVRSGKLRNSVTKEYSSFHFAKKSKNTLEIGTQNISYARVHQFGFFGSQRKRRVTIKIPQREYIRPKQYTNDLEKRFQKVIINSWREQVDNVLKGQR